MEKFTEMEKKVIDVNNSAKTFISLLTADLNIKYSYNKLKIQAYSN